MAFALETIAYQLKDSFTPKLISLVKEIYDYIDAKKVGSNTAILKNHPAVGRIEDLIFKRFGMQVVFAKHLHAFTPGAIVPFFGDYYRDVQKATEFSLSGLFGFSTAAYGEINQITQEREKLRKKLHNRTGYIDTKLAKMGGYLSDVKHYLIIDFVGFKNLKLTESELSAVILHELGHAFDGMEEHHRLERTNRAVFDVLCQIHDKDYERAVYIYKNEISQEEFDHIALDDSKVRYDFCGKLALSYLKTVKSQMPDNKYDETNFENMADTFAARFGMGKELVSGLHKLNLLSGNVINRTPMAIGLYRVFDLLVIASVLLIFPIWGSAVWFGLTMMLNNSRVEDMTYDKTIDRYNRVLNTIVNALKKLDAPDDVIKDLLAQYAYINDLIQRFAAPTSLTHELADIVIPQAKSARYYSDLQKTLEYNLNNDLFVKSAMLKVL